MCFSDYSSWNRALLKHFFPTGNENPILYLDETLLENVAKENRIGEKGNSFSEDLLSCTLISQNNIGTFFNALANAAGNHNLNGCRTWNDLVTRLMNSTLPYTYTDQNIRTIQVPAYFAMLCSIMLLASRNGANHEAMTPEANTYLNRNTHPGALVDDLMQQLHINFQSFDPDRMVGNQRHMGRIKYHLVLTKSQRDDFIDFVEVNNLKWEYGTYESFVNDVLVPALNEAGKNDLLGKVIQEDNIPYFKNILSDSNLNWGKAPSESNNQIQEKVFKWKYECRFDYDGKLWFNIYFDYHLPFGLCLKKGRIERCDTPNDSEYIARNLDTFPIINEPSTINDNGICYKICNANDGYQDKRFYFECIGDDFYRQVDFPEDGKTYYVFLRYNDRPQQGWEIDNSFILNGHSAYKIVNYQRPRNRRVDNNNVRLKDKFDLVQCGSYFSIFLEDGQELWWKPNIVGQSKEKVNGLRDGKDGKKYFRIKPTDQQGQCLSGSLFVQCGDKEILSQRISTRYNWGGSTCNYHLDSWGRVVKRNGNPCGKKQDYHLTRKPPIEGNSEPTSGTVMLLQILNDIADENGCIYGRKISDALDFVLSSFGITPSIEKRKSILYALRWLGYIIADYDINRREYVNQLIPKYIEKSGYSVTASDHAYILKGCYRINERDELINNATYKRYLRPYDEETLKKYPEYCCLPDAILLERANLETSGWPQMNHPIAHDIIYDMADMNGFITTFGIDNNGDRYNGGQQLDTPCMVENDGNIVLCTNRDGVYYTHKYYRDNNLFKFIPKPLAKVYVQNSHNSPVCAMSYGKQINNLDYSCISFFEGMGVPDLLRTALCDLNLGMASADYVFIVEKDSINRCSSLGTDNSPITKMFTYKTTTRTEEHRILAEAVKKLSGGRLNDGLTSCPEIVLTIKEDCWHEMIMSKDSHRATLFLYEKEQSQDKTLVAFSIGSRVYYRRPNSEGYRKVTNDGTVNFILSQIINGNGKNLNVSDETKDPPEHTDNLTIKIIKKHNIKQS